MFDIKNIDKAIESLDRIATSFEKANVQLEKMTKMQEKCMKFIGVTMDITDIMMTEVAKEAGNEEDPAFLLAKQGFARIKKEFEDTMESEETTLEEFMAK